MPQVQRVQQMHPSGDAISEVATDVVIPSARAAEFREVETSGTKPASRVKRQGRCVGV